MWMLFFMKVFNDSCALMGRHGRAHRRRHYPSPPNHAVCHYPIGVILSIAQGWQVQRCLPWVTVQARRLPPWGLYFFSSHILTTRGEWIIREWFPHMQIDFKKYNADGIGPPHDFPQGSLLSSATLGWQKYNTDGVGSCAPFSPTNKTSPTLQHWGRKCIAHSRPFYFKISQIMLSSSPPWNGRSPLS